MLSRATNSTPYCISPWHCRAHFPTESGLRQEQRWLRRKPLQWEPLQISSLERLPLERLPACLRLDVLDLGDDPVAGVLNKFFVGRPSTEAEMSLISLRGHYFEGRKLWKFCRTDLHGLMAVIMATENLIQKPVKTHAIRGNCDLK